MRREDFKCWNCLCSTGATPDDIAKFLCALGPRRVPVKPDYWCGSGKWRGAKVEAISSPGRPPDGDSVVTEGLISYGEWDEE
jgi:hypothetical protein